MKLKTQPFHSRWIGNVLEVWLGPPDNPESERVLALNAIYLPALLATVRANTKVTRS